MGQAGPKSGFRRAHGAIGSGVVARAWLPWSSILIELLSQPATLASKPGRSASGTARTAARDWIWLFGVAVLGLCAEWLMRRRLGLR